MTSASPRPENINNLREGADLSFAMLAGMQLDVFTPLKDGRLTLEQAADALGVRALKLRPLMYALVVAGLLDVEEGRFFNTPEANRFLVQGSPDYMGGIRDNLAYRWSAMLNTAESIRTGVPQAKLDFSEGSEEELESFLRGLHGETMASGRELLEKRDLTSVRTLADVGGGSGGLAIAIIEALPHINATVVDLPSVTPITQRIVEEAGAAERVAVMAADVVNDSLIGSFDVAVLRSLIQVLSPEDALRALRNVREAIAPSGVIYIIGRTVDHTRLSPISSVLFSVFTLNRYDEGQAYSEQEYLEWLAEAGFEGADITPLSGGVTLISATNPG